MAGAVDDADVSLAVVEAASVDTPVAEAEVVLDDCVVAAGVVATDTDDDEDVVGGGGGALELVVLG